MLIILYLPPLSICLLHVNVNIREINIYYKLNPIAICSAILYHEIRGVFPFIGEDVV